MRKKIKVGIIGCGAIGKVHADAYLATGQADLVALCDIDQAKLAALGKHAGVDILLDDYRKLLASEVEAVSVCVPNSLHAEMAIAALAAGKHLLLEKPVALNASQAGQIVAASEKAGTITQVGMVWRHSPQAKVLRDYVEAGHFGDIYHMRAVMVRRRGIPGMGRWFTTKAVSGGGPMIDLGVHWFDMAMFLSGLWQPTRVSAQVYAKFGPAMRDYRYVGMWAAADSDRAPRPPGRHRPAVRREGQPLRGPGPQLPGCMPRRSAARGDDPAGPHGHETHRRHLRLERSGARSRDPLKAEWS